VCCTEPQDEVAARLRAVSAITNTLFYLVVSVLTARLHASAVYAVVVCITVSHKSVLH